MPNTFLLPITEADGKVSDPAADITAFLMRSTEGWKPNDVPSINEMSAAEHDALLDLALLYVKEKFSDERAKQILKEGIPLAHSGGVKGDESLLVWDGSGGEAQANAEFVEVRWPQND